MIFLTPGKCYTSNAAFSKGHWYRKKRRDEVKQAAGEVIDRMIQQMDPGTIPYPMVEIECQMQYTRKGNFCDTDAPAPFKKAVLDTLVDRGVLVDDTSDIVRGVKYLPPIGGQETEGLLVLVHPVEVIT